MKEKGREKRKKKRTTGPAAEPKPRRRSFWLNVLPDDLWLKVPRGDTILDALEKVDINLEGDCGGLVKCGKCRVKVLTSVDFPPPNEVNDLLSEEEIREGYRLACCTKIRKDLAVYLGESRKDLEYFQILKAGETPQIELDPLVDKQIIYLSSEEHVEGKSDIDRIRDEMGWECGDIKPSLSCLRSLPDSLRDTGYHGTAVFHENTLLAWQDREKGDRNYGLVFDLGTSTLVAKLINMSDGQQVAAVSRLNRQIRYGTDVIRRIQQVKENPAGLQKMHDLLIRDLQELVGRLLAVSGISADEVFVAVAAGNTTMQHFLLGLNPSAIAEAPFSPVITDGLVVKAADVDLSLHPEALFYLMPAKSGYIGGDLISVILASHAWEQDEELVLGLDLGTNGEIFLGNRKRILTCSAAAGPALEGSKISHGSIAKVGAIEGVRLVDNELQYREIGNIRPTGICGSGLVDLVSVLLECGVIDREGLIRCPGADSSETFPATRVVERNGVCDFLVAPAEESFDGRPIYLTQRDVRELQLAKAAVAAGIQVLLEEMGADVGDVQRICLAGALGNYVNPYSAMNIGLLPTVDPGLITSLGNAASTGASMVLLSRAYWRKANELSRFIEHVELSTRQDFTENFVSNMDFPEENPWERREVLNELQASGFEQ